MNDLICSMDIASTSAEVCCCDDAGKPGKPFNLKSDEEGHRELVRRLKPGTKVVMESTGDYHRSWARVCTRAGFEVYVVNALLLKRLGTVQNGLRDNKTDKIDTVEIAIKARTHLHELGNYRFEECERKIADKELTNLKARLTKMKRDCTNSSIHMIYVMLPLTGSMTFTGRQDILQLFLEIESLKQLRGMRRSTIEKYAHSQTEALVAAYSSSLVNEELFDQMLTPLKASLQMIFSIIKNISELEKTIKERLEQGPDKEDVELAQSLPGIGAGTSAVLIAHLPNKWRTWGPKRRIMKKMQAYFGFEPKEKESGFYKGVVRMSKRGNPAPRTALYQIAVSSLRTDGRLKYKYDAMREAGKPHGIAISNIMRIHLRRLIAVLYDRRPYCPDFLQEFAQN